MATITTGTPVFYRLGTSGVSNLVGYDGANRVGRYSFTSPSSGATSVSFSFRGIGGGSTGAVAFYIGTSDNDHADARENNGYAATGHVAITSNSGLIAEGSADILLVPNTTYYLWFYPADTTAKYWYFPSGAISFTTAGSATYTVSYNKGTYGVGTNTSATKTHGTALTLSDAIFTRSGYTQEGWSSIAAGTTKAYDLNAQYTTDASVTLYPYWEAAGLVYIDNGSSFDAYTVHVDNGTTWEQYQPYIDNGTGWDLYS